MAGEFDGAGTDFPTFDEEELMFEIVALEELSIAVGEGKISRSGSGIGLVVRLLALYPRWRG